MTIEKALKKIFDEWGEGKMFYGYELKNCVANYVPETENSYIETIMRKARQYVRDRFICVDGKTSLYKVVK